MKKSVFFVAALFAACLFFACSSDDDKQVPSASTVVGTWQLVREEGWEKSDGKTYKFTNDFPDEDGFYSTLTFDKDGSGIYVGYETGYKPWVVVYTYVVAGNAVIMEFSEYDVKETMLIKELTKSKLIWQTSGEDYEYTQTLQRVN